MRRTLRRSGWLLVKRGDREQVLSCGSYTRSLGLRLDAQPMLPKQMIEKSEKNCPVRFVNLVDQDAGWHSRAVGGISYFTDFVRRRRKDVMDTEAP